MEKEMDYSTFHPDNLIVGKRYRFKYQTYTNVIRRVVGRFKRMDVEFGSLFLYFTEKNEKKETAFEIKCIVWIKEDVCND